MLTSRRPPDERSVGTDTQRTELTVVIGYVLPGITWNFDFRKTLS